MMSLSSSVRFVFAMVSVLLVFELIARAVSGTTPEPQRWYDASAEMKIEQMDAIEKVDVVFAGTSMAWQGLVPSEYLSISKEYETGYNAGLAGGIPTVMERWLLEEVIPRTDPDLVVWGLSSLDIAPNYGEENLDRYNAALETREGWLADVERVLAERSSLIATRSNLRDPSRIIGPKADELATQREEATLYMGADGHRLDFRENISDDLGLVQQARLAGFAVDGGDLDAIRRVVDTLRAQGREVAFVSMPVPQRFRDLHPGGDDGFQITAAAINNLAVELDVVLIDKSDRFGNARFVDFTHLNAEAAGMTSRQVARELERGEDDRQAVMSVQTVEEQATQGQSTQDTCVIELIEDEYGIQTEVLVCDTPTGTPGSDTNAQGADNADSQAPQNAETNSIATGAGDDPTVAFEDTVESRDFVELLRDSLWATGNCGMSLGERFDRFEQQAAANRITALGSYADVRTTTVAAHDASCNQQTQAWAQSTQAGIEALNSLAAEFSAGSGDAWDPEPLNWAATTSADAGPLAVQQRIVPVMNRLEVLFTSRNRPSIWQTYDGLANIHAVQDAGGQVTTDFLLLGNSRALRLDPVTVQQVSGRDAWSLAMAATPADLNLVWARQTIADRITAPEYVFVLSALDLTSSAGSEDCVAQLNTRQRIAEETGLFASIFSALPDAPTWTAWFDAESVLTIEQPTHLDRYISLAQGGQFEARVVTEEQSAEDIETIARRIVNAHVCNPRVDELLATIEEVRAAGIRVTVVHLPPNPAAVEAAARDGGNYAELRDDILTRMNPFVNATIDLSDGLNDESYFEDGSHFGQLGMQAASELLGQRLADG